ncbi:MAG: hypothetical protein VYC47_01160, partial [Verrucomicrobiota bacterium]|nr:hypothetical protein [Verrucomicrobiota bacterium]
MKRLGFVLILTCLSSGSVLFGTEPAASLEARLKAVAKTFRASYKTKPDKNHHQAADFRRSAWPNNPIKTK